MTSPRRRSEVDAEFRETIAQMLRCISADGLAAFPGWQTPAGQSRVLRFQPVRSRLDQVNRGRLFLSVERVFVLATDAAGRPHVRTLSYIYNLFDAHDRRVLGWHYHPEGRGEQPIPIPHLHVYGEADVAGRTLSRLHLPTSRVELETVVTFLIEELGVEPREQYRRMERGEPRWRRILRDGSDIIARLEHGIA